MLKKSIQYPLSMVLLTLAALFIFFETSSSAANEITLSWDPNTEPDLEGYVLYGKQGSQDLPFDYVDTYPEVDLADPLNPRAVVTDLESDVTYYFAVTAYDTEGNESDYSNVVSVLNGNMIETDGNSNGDGGGGGSGGGGGCFINTAGFLIPHFEY
ncbi:MAG: fibronectin type III domain-containing protein [Desulfobacterales bacterium]|jgi:hypothetical protein